jgi:hypothetical protein
MERAQKVALGSVGVGLVVLGLKFAAYWLTGSIALSRRPKGGGPAWRLTPDSRLPGSAPGL